MKSNAFTKTRLWLAFALVLSMGIAAASVSAHHEEADDYYPIETEEFQTVWERTDLPVHELIVARTWIWSPAAHTPLLTEDYTEGEDGERDVQYFDKSRMEMPTEGVADADSESSWHITQGLLATELMTGNLQLGDDTFEQYQPSQRSAAGDPGDTTAPTYATMGELMERDARAGGEVIVEHADRDGSVTEDATRFGAYEDVYDVEGDWQDVEGIDKNIASVFWEFMNSTGVVYEDGEYVDDQPIFLNAFYAVGYPLTDAFWADVTVDGVEQDVLIQAFERRVLTYTPGNPEGWEVESGNIGQHYYHWRYTEIPAQVPTIEIDLQPELAVNPLHYNREQAIPIIAQAFHEQSLPDERFGTVEDIEAHLAQFVDDGLFYVADAVIAWIEAGIAPPEAPDLEAEVESWQWRFAMIPMAVEMLAELGFEVDQAVLESLVEADELGRFDLVPVLNDAVDAGFITSEQRADILAFAETSTVFHEMTANVTLGGEAVTEGSVSFVVTNEQGDIIVDSALDGIEIENGSATFSYWPPAPGIHTIIATVLDTDVEATATKVWTPVVVSIQPADEPGS